jgi:hypothetical protein
MKLTKDIFDKTIENASVFIDDVKVMFNWGAPTSLSTAEYDAAVSSHQMLFNNYEDGLKHFFEGDQAKLISSYLAGVSIGTTSNALSNSSTNAVGYGTFSGTDLISIPEEMCHEDWTVIINFEEEGCPSDPSKNRILLSTKQACSNETSSTTTTTSAPLNSGFSIGINGAKNLFYEYYDIDGTLRKHTVLSTLNDKNIISICKSQKTQSLNIYIYDLVESTVKEALISTKKHRLSEKWYLGGTYPVAAAGAEDQMFVGKIYEFLLFSTFLSKDQVNYFCKALAADSMTNAGYQTVTETYYPSDGYTEQSVQTGTEITGYTSQSYTIQDANNNTITLYDLVPVTAPIYENQVTYTLSSTSATRDSTQYQSTSATYDYVYIKGYAPSCISLSTVDSSSKSHELYTCNQYTKELGKKAAFSAGHFVLEEDHGSAKSVVIYVNGVFQENGVGYTRDGIKINKYTGTYTEDDTLIYDLIDNGVQDFIDFTGSSTSVTHTGRAGQDVYLDGLKLVYEVDYENSGSDLVVFANGLASGRMAFVTRYTDINKFLNGTIVSFLNMGEPLISEQLWVNKLRKLRGSDYFLRSACDLNSASNPKTAGKATLIYENNQSHFNI